MPIKNAVCWTTAAGLLAVACTATVLVTSYSPAPASAATLVAASAEDPTPLSGNRLAQDLIEAGLSPEHMAASGATLGQAETAWAAAAAEASSVATAMDQARGAIESATMAIQPLERRVRRGHADQSDLTELTSLRSTLATQVAIRDGLIADIRAAALGCLDGTCCARLGQLHEDDLGLDAAYRVVERDQADAVALREALADVHVSSKRGVDPAPASLTLIGEAETDPAVAAAKAGLASLLAPMKAEWDALLAGE